MNRQQWQRAIEPAPENFHRAVAHALRTKEERQPMKRAIPRALILACALVLALAVGIYLLIRYQRERQKELYRMEALRDSRLYKDIYPLILRAAARDLDQVRIERDRITFTLVCPPGTLGVFELCQCGHRQMSRTRTRVLAEVIAEDIEILRDRGKYGLSRYRITRANGSVDYGYVYTIRTPYKDAVMEARRRISMRIGI